MHSVNTTTNILTAYINQEQKSWVKYDKYYFIATCLRHSVFFTLLKIKTNFLQTLYVSLNI